ncbi:MAG: DUF305 domain-containing protein [Gemmatimonadota bacterium]|nr:DUF305 domain-containing protein [Gemmatimonadota bacterium]
MKLSHRTRAAAVTLSAAALVGGGVAYAVNQSVEPRSAGTSETTMMSGQGMGMGSFDRAQPFDAQFIDQMIVHHQGAIMSTQMMIADSDRPELRNLAQDIITNQRGQITQMRKWRAQWYPDLEPTFGGMSGSMMGGTGDDEPMMGGTGDDEPMMGGSMMGGTAGSERMYLQMMIVHHQLGVDMAEQAQQDATHPELTNLAAVIAEEQAAQITQMRGYLAASPEPTAG